MSHASLSLQDVQHFLLYYCMQCQVVLCSITQAQKFNHANPLCSFFKDGCVLYTLLIPRCSVEDRDFRGRCCHGEGSVWDLLEMSGEEIGFQFRF